MAKFQIKDINGVIPALITPFDEKENFDEKRMRAVVEHLLKRGVHGLYLTGSTGESFLMTPDERKRVVAVVVDQVGGRVPVIAQIGNIGTKKSIDLAQHAERAGVDAISSLPPFYWHFGNDNIFNYYKEITESTDLPMIVYSISLAGLMSFEQVKRFSTIGGVKGIKYTATTHFEIMRMKEELGDDFMIYSGCDEMSLSGLSFGADGIIGSFYNMMPEIFFKLYDAMKNNDLQTAEELQHTANILIIYSLQKNCLAVMKRALAWMGIDGGYCRSPFVNFDKAGEKKLKKEFKALKAKHKITGVDFLDAI